MHAIILYGRTSLAAVRVSEAAAAIKAGLGSWPVSDSRLFAHDIAHRGSGK